MPLYEYKCSGCGKTFEVIQKFSDEPLKTHPECGGPTERLLSPPALQFKGSGWYVTDYARSKEAQGKEAKANGSSKSEGGSDAAKTGSGDKKSGSDSSSESKPAASSETKSTSSSSSTSNPK
jgi:putative FmdB family regulatory protein